MNNFVSSGVDLWESENKNDRNFFNFYIVLIFFLSELENLLEIMTKEKEIKNKQNEPKEKQKEDNSKNLFQFKEIEKNSNDSFVNKSISETKERLRQNNILCKTPLTNLLKSNLNESLIK